MRPEKVNLINILQLLASPNLQQEYNDEVSFASVPDELIAQWFDDFFFSDDDEFISLFSDCEWKVLMDFHDVFKNQLASLPRDFENMKGDPGWGTVIASASGALNDLGWSGLVAKYDEE